MTDKHLIEDKQSSEYIFNGSLLQVYKDTVVLPNGKIALREYIKHQGAVAVVPVTLKNEIIVVKQYRYPIGRTTIEIPAGKLDKGEEPLIAAKRELSEETGVFGADIESIGNLYPSVAYTDELIYMYMARNLQYGNKHTDEDEFLDVDKIYIEDFIDMILKGEIEDSKTQAAVLKVYTILKMNNEI